MFKSPMLPCLASHSLLLGPIFCVFFAATSSLAAEPAKVKAVYTAIETKEFKELAKATITALDAGKEKEMTAKITDLETAWDAKESVLKPKDEKTWTAIDKTLDKGISAIRSSKTDLKKGKAALEELIKMLGDATKP